MTVDNENVFKFGFILSYRSISLPNLAPVAKGYVRTVFSGVLLLSLLLLLLLLSIIIFYCYYYRYYAMNIMHINDNIISKIIITTIILLLILFIKAHRVTLNDFRQPEKGFNYNYIQHAAPGGWL